MTSLAWTVNSKGQVWTLHEQGGGDSYSQPDFARDIGVGADGTVWVVTNKPQQAPYDVYGYTLAWLADASKQEWQELAGTAAAVNVAVGPDGVAWTVNAEGQVWTLTKQGGGDSYSSADLAQNIGVGAEGTVWVVTKELQQSSDGFVPAWLVDPSEKIWTKLDWPAAAVAIAVQ